MQTMKNISSVLSSLAMKRIAINISSFELLRTNNYIYVDKTQYIYSLVEPPFGYYFISRPRRYGKSLFCSTLDALFKGKKELFKGLYISEKTTYNFAKYPVVHFNFANLSSYSFDEFRSSLQDMIRRAGDEYEVEIERKEDPARMLLDLILTLNKKFSKQIVIIIDEFDDPVISSLDRPYIGKIIDVFSSFYSQIKNNSELIRFLFITGVTKLSNVSIFSKMNNLIDLSMNASFASAFGYDENEVEEYFGSLIDEYCREHNEQWKDKRELTDAISDYYDGYRFSPYSNKLVYNPVSLGFFFSESFIFRNYWEMTEISTLAVTLAKKYNLSEIIMGEQRIAISAFTSFDISVLSEKKLTKRSIIALLYYAGYLTIKGEIDGGLILGFPNTEIASSFTESLSLLYSEDSDVSSDMIMEGKVAINNGDTAMLISALSKFYSNSSSMIIRAKLENPYHLIFHMFFVACGARVSSEEGTLTGRIDTVIEKKDTIYIAELKVDISADDALNQIKAKHYHEKYLSTGKRIHLLCVSFSSKNEKHHQLERGDHIAS